MRGNRSSSQEERLDFRIRPTKVEDGEAVHETILLANGYGGRREVPCINRAAVAEQLQRFPEGQYVAVVGSGAQERVIAMASTMRTNRPPTSRPLPWLQMIGSYGLANHDPEGDWLYGVEIAVQPRYQRKGVASALYRVRLGLVEKLGLRGWYAGGMLMGYHRFRDRLTVREYARKVLAGEISDPTVSMQVHRGLQPRGIIEDYCVEAAAGNCAVLLVWQPPKRGRPRKQQKPTVAEAIVRR